MRAYVLCLPCLFSLCEEIYGDGVSRQWKLMLVIIRYDAVHLSWCVAIFTDSQAQKDQTCLLLDADR